ncbi:MAG TPA: LamG domain-containing protein [Bacillota bacterium]|nr:LamG domain-containing protein [Bacillota bacterium]
MSRRQVALAVALLVVVGACGTCGAAPQGLWMQWILDPSHVSSNTLIALHGLPGKTDGPMDWIDGPDGKWYRMDGSSNHFVIYSGATSGLALPSSAITVEAWAMVSESANWAGLASFIQDNGSYERGWMLGCLDGRFMFGLASLGDRKVTDPYPSYLTYMKADGPYEIGKWYHVVGVYDGTTMRLYVDGRLAAESKDQHGVICQPDQGVLAIGAYVDNDERHNLPGAIREVRIYSRALTADEVASSMPGSVVVSPDADAAQGIPVRLLMLDGSTIEGFLVGAYGMDLLVAKGSATVQRIDSRQVGSVLMWPK